MFEGLRNIFKKKEEEKKEVLMSFAELREYFWKNIEEKKQAVINEASSIKASITEMLKEAVQIVDEMNKRDIVEKRAKNSEAIKNRFCEKSRLILSSILDGQPNSMTSFADIEAYLGYMRKSLAKIDLSPKEVMHIKFFFTEDLNKLIRKMNEIGLNVEKINNILGSSFMIEKKKTESLLRKISENEKSLGIWNEKLDSLSKELKSLENDKNKMSFTDLSEFSSVRSDIRNLDTRISYLRQQINSEFGGFSKILKRIYHKEKDIFIESYIDTPFDAFMEDRENNVRNLLLKTIIMIKDGKIDVDRKIIGKLEDLTERIDELSQYRQEIYDLDLKSKTLKELEETLSEKEQINKRNKKEAADIERKIDDIAKMRKNIEENIENSRKQIEKDRISCVESISFLFGEKFNVHDLYAETIK